MATAKGKLSPARTTKQRNLPLKFNVFVKAKLPVAEVVALPPTPPPVHHKLNLEVWREAQAKQEMHECYLPFLDRRTGSELLGEMKHQLHNVRKRLGKIPYDDDILRDYVITDYLGLKRDMDRDPSLDLTEPQRYEVGRICVKLRSLRGLPRGYPPKDPKVRAKREFSDECQRRFVFQSDYGLMQEIVLEVPIRLFSSHELGFVIRNWREAQYYGEDFHFAHSGLRHSAEGFYVELRGREEQLFLEQAREFVKEVGPSTFLRRKGKPKQLELFE